MAVINSILLILILGMSASVPAEVMRVTLLGTGGPPPHHQRFGTGTLVEAGEHRLLFDAGRGIVQRLHENGSEIQRVGPVFLTHLHHDHIVGLPDLWLTGWVWQRVSPLAVFGPKGTSAHAASLERAYAFDVAQRVRDAELEPESTKISVREIESGVAFEEGKLRVQAFPVDHGSVKPALGYRIDFGDRSVVISGDTRYSENLVHAAKGVDLLIHEVAAAPEALARSNPGLKKVLDYHTTPQAAGRVFKETAPRMAVFTHVLLFGGMTEQQLIADVRKAGYAGPLKWEKISCGSMWANS
jgi:ribonuclease Z